MKQRNWEKYLFEFLSIFVAVLLAFALNNWNDNRRDRRAELKILTEISNGLAKDTTDMNINMMGHRQGLRACAFFQHILTGKPESMDSVGFYYIALTRDFTSIQNTSGYETLKSKGLELIENDSLRTSIIALYEYDYQTLEKLEEDYHELQFQKNYFHKINQHLAPYFRYDARGAVVGIQLPVELNDTERNVLLSYLWKIRVNRRFVLGYYRQIQQKVSTLKAEIERELKQ